MVGREPHPYQEARFMVTITFPDREAEKWALAFLLGRFSGRVLRSGEHQISAAAVAALADQRIPFIVRERGICEEPIEPKKDGPN